MIITNDVNINVNISFRLTNYAKTPNNTLNDTFIEILNVV